MPGHSPCYVSVVVPVFNPGAHLDPCVAGLLEQTIDRGRFEVVFIDDGSSDDSPARLDQLAAEHEWIRVVHQENSGWPGQPRNLGIELARGEYIFFSDHDDRLGPEALERMVERAHQTGADILVPKGVSLGRPVPRGLFRKNVDRAVLGVDPLSTSTAPHKLFRRAFLDTHGLRFPEGKRRLEDGVFVMAAYLKADVITILADYPCYYRYARDDGKNAALQPWTAEYYFPFVAEVIDVIEAGTEPGELRNSLLVRPYVLKMLGKLTGRRMFRWSPDHRQAIFDEVRRLALERFPIDFHETHLPIVKRAHARALVTNRLDRMMAVADCVATVSSRATIQRLVWEDDHWLAEIEAELVFGDGSPITVTPTSDGWTFDTKLIPGDLAGPAHPLAAITAGEIDVTLAHHSEKVEWFADASTHAGLVPVAGAAEDAHRVVFRSTARVDPSTVAGGSPLSPGRWDVKVRVAAWGLDGTSPLTRAPRAKAAVTRTPALFEAAAIKVVPETKKPKPEATVRTLRLRVTSTTRFPVKLLLRRVRQLTVTPDGDLTAAIDVTIAPAGPPRTLDLLLLDPADAIVATSTADIAITRAGALLTSHLANGSQPLPAGRLRIAVGSERRARLLGAVKVGHDGHVGDIEARKPRPITISGARPQPAASHRRLIGRRHRS
jgi:glycosyltransferase involved in cell wall biosynthesis